MKKHIVFLALLVLGVALCGPAAAEEITIVGTGSGMSVLESLGNEFSQQNQGITISVPPSIGSGGGIKAVGNDEYLIGRVARGIKAKEQHYGLTYLPYAKSPVVFYANKSCGVTELTAQQACEIYSGKVTNWKEVGGNDARIKVIRREEGDSSLSVLLELLPGFKDITITSKSKTTNNDQATCVLAEKTSDAIAFGPYTDAKNYEVNIMSINGKHPEDADYPYVGILAFIFKEKNKTGNVKKFIEFATSAEGRNTIKNAGAIPY